MTFGRAENNIQKDRDSDENGADQQPGGSSHAVLFMTDLRPSQFAIRKSDANANESK
jgi:hypothetical protein